MSDIMFIIVWRILVEDCKVSEAYAVMATLSMSVQPIDLSVSSITGGSAERLEQFQLPDRYRLAPDQARGQGVAFESSRMDLTQLRTGIDNWLTDRLLAADGVAGVDVAGGLEREIR